MNKVVRASFFKRDPLTCARELIGTELVWDECSGVVVEVEAYAAIDDEAAHTLRDRVRAALSSETKRARRTSISTTAFIGC